MFENQPKGLWALALANTGERFGYYTMLAVFALFLRANFGLDPGTAGTIYGSFLMLVYFLPLIGGIIADKIGFGKCVTFGIVVMFLGYVFLAVPLGGDGLAMAFMLLALFFISFGTGMFKGNLQVMVGNLYDDPKYANKRDAAFSLFYMAINVGAFVAPTAAVKIMEYAQSIGYEKNDSYHFAFAVACISLIISMIIYYAFRSTFRHVEGGKKKEGEKSAPVEELTKEQTKERVIALCLVFAVVVFFWMAFHQNGLSLTYFADEFTVKETHQDWQVMAFDTEFCKNLFNMAAVMVLVYAAFGFFQSQSKKAKRICGFIVVMLVAFLLWQYDTVTGSVSYEAPIFQQFNPFYVVALTPVSMAIFGSLAAKGKEPSAPRKIAYGMIVAAVAFFFMAWGSIGLNTPNAQKVAGEAATLVSPNYLIITYLILTFGELLLSPMGISFVSKVAPPKLKGMMMGGWFVATALGNQLVTVGGLLWGDLPLTVVWSVFAILCLLSAIFMFSIMKRLEKVC
ncbi:MAG: peptide MFS transporter [Bacteroidaceae bacterium]|nr:peptide MFS transporter [Bacteroidaceae bacterium]